jgi:hypothetical protein
LLRDALQPIRRFVQLHDVIVVCSLVGMRAAHRVGAGDHDGQQIEAVLRCGRHFETVEGRVAATGTD